MDLNRRLPRVDASNFSLVPRADIPRSTFVSTHTHKTTFNAGPLVPIHLDEVLPGDVHQGEVSIFARLATPIFPIMDEIEVETFFFFVPMRLLWSNAKKFFGERANPSDSISYTIPQAQMPNGVLNPGTLQDYMGIPAGAGVFVNDPVNALPFRAYYAIYNDWFRDQNLQNSLTIPLGDGPDAWGTYVLQTRNKKPDYFTSALPWPLKGGVEIAAPLQGQAKVLGIATDRAGAAAAGAPGAFESDGSGSADWPGHYTPANITNQIYFRTDGAVPELLNIYADLTTATGATINAIRLAFQTQKLLERDARSGTRYTELLRAHFGVFPEDARLQRPEYIGGGRTAVQTQAIPQTSATGLTGGTSPLGALGASAIAADKHSFSYHATEHGYILGLANVRAQNTYQQGLHRMWTRQTRYDFYWPTFAFLGEQIVRNDEIWYTVNNPAVNGAAFGYQERWAEYRHRPSRISGLFRSDVATNIDEWHLAQDFASLPALNSTFITDGSTAVLQRALAAGAAADNMQVLFDSLFRIRTTRAMPMFSVPGNIDRF